MYIILFLFVCMYGCITVDIERINRGVVCGVCDGAGGQEQRRTGFENPKLSAPSCPWKLRPNPHTSPLLTCTRVLNCPAATDTASRPPQWDRATKLGVMLGSTDPGALRAPAMLGPHCPLRLEPHVNTSPLDESATLWYRPVLSDLC